MPIAEFLARVRRLPAPGTGPTPDKMREAIDQVVALGGVESTFDLTASLVARWVKAMMESRISRASIEDLLGDFGAACDHAVAWRALWSNPVGFRRRWLPAGYDRADAPPPAGPTPLSAGEATRLMAHLLRESVTWEGHRLYALAAVLVYAGLRRNQALLLRVADCDLDARLIRLPCGETRQVPGHLLTILSEWLPETRCEWAFPGAKLKGPWKEGRAETRALGQLRAAGERAGIEGVTLERLGGLWRPGTAAVELGEEFRPLPAPERPYRGPKPHKGPSGKPKAAVRLFGPHRPPVVFGRRMTTLGLSAFKVVKATLSAFPGGILLGGLEDASGVKQPDVYIRRLKASHENWDRALITPGGNGRGGYSIAPDGPDGTPPETAEILV